jgi:hypothetical protein
MCLACGTHFQLSLYLSAWQRGYSKARLFAIASVMDLPRRETDPNPNASQQPRYQWGQKWHVVRTESSLLASQVVAAETCSAGTCLPRDWFSQ